MIKVRAEFEKMVILNALPLPLHWNSFFHCYNDAQTDGIYREYKVKFLKPEKKEKVLNDIIEKYVAFDDILANLPMAAGANPPEEL